MNVLITGGAGFIGSHLVDLLLVKGHNIKVLDNFSTGRIENIDHLEKHVEVIKCDLAFSGNWEEHFKNVDWVFHLASLADIVPSIKDPRSNTLFRMFRILNGFLAFLGTIPCNDSSALSAGSPQSPRSGR